MRVHETFTTPEVVRAFAIGRHLVRKARTEQLVSLRRAQDAITPTSIAAYREVVARRLGRGTITPAEALVLNDVLLGWLHASLEDRIAVSFLLGLWMPELDRAAQMRHLFERLQYVN